MNKYQKISFFIIILIHQSVQIDASYGRGGNYVLYENTETIRERRQREERATENIRLLQRQIASETDDEQKKKLIDKLKRLSIYNQAR